MRAVAIILILVIVLAAAGWLVFSFGDNQMTVEFNADKAEADTEKILDKSNELIDRATNSPEENVEDESDQT